MSISAGFEAGDVLAYPALIGSITGTYHPLTGVLDLTGSDTVANYQLALASITFSETGDNPSTSRTVSFSVNDGTLDSNTATKDIVITPVNDAPTVTTSVGIAELRRKRPADRDRSGRDRERSGLRHDGQRHDPDHRRTTPRPRTCSASSTRLTITGSYNAATGLLTLTGSDTLANYQAALQSVTYQDTSANPSTLTRTITFTVNDGALRPATTPPATCRSRASTRPPW